MSVGYCGDVENSMVLIGFIMNKASFTHPLWDVNSNVFV